MAILNCWDIYFCVQIKLRSYILENIDDFFFTLATKMDGYKKEKKVRRTRTKRKEKKNKDI